MSKENSKIVDKIWVTSEIWGRDSHDSTVYIPCSGVKLDEIGDRLGGWKTAVKACGNCEANVARSESGKNNLIAGCFGDLEVMYPSSGSLDELLWKVIDRLNIQDELADAFQLTDPLWFGFWMKSPLDRKQCRILLQLLSAALPLLWASDPADPGSEPVFDDVRFAFSDFDPAAEYGRDYQAFFRALDASTKYDLPLHVYVPPPGHVDLGWYTVFAHCPRCKAVANVERWQEVESQQYECSVCGNVFDPSKTCSSEQDEFDLDSNSLAKLLGSTYDDFVIKYGEKFGHPREQMIDALDVHREGPVKRKVAQARRLVRSTRMKLRSVQPNRIELASQLTMKLPGDVPLELVFIPSGQFLMGESPSMEERQMYKDSDNKSPSWCTSLPEHAVRFEKPFYMGKYPITQQQWLAVMEQNPSRCKSPLHPVEQVDWFESQRFCARLSLIQSCFFRLPSEAEWEYACRAGTTGRCYCGDVIGPHDGNVDHIMKFGDFPSFDNPIARTTPVDRFPPNPWGLYDMLGNVQEWCDDSWHPNYEGAPCDGSAWIDDPEPIDHIARGGAAYVIAARCTCGSRILQRANMSDPNLDESGEDCDDELGKLLRSQPYYIGLRVVCEVSDLAPFSE